MSDGSCDRYVMLDAGSEWAVIFCQHPRAHSGLHRATVKNDMGPDEGVDVDITWMSS